MQNFLYLFKNVFFNLISLNQTKWIQCPQITFGCFSSAAILSLPSSPFHTMDLLLKLDLLLQNSSNFGFVCLLSCGII